MCVCVCAWIRRIDFFGSLFVMDIIEELNTAFYGIKFQYGKVKNKNQKVHKERRITKRTKIIRVRAILKIL